MRTNPIWTAIAAVVSLTAVASEASAYCLTTTCDPNVEDCAIDADGCATKGKGLYWPVACASYDLSAESTPGIPFDAFSETAAAAFGAWTSADCGGGQAPSIRVKDLGPVQSASTCYNQRAGNVNVIFFQSKKWPYAGGSKTIALTTVTFNTDTGEIYDADMEINSAEMALTVSDTNVEYDLQSVITHETGHYFGLAHAGPSHKDSTMYETYAAKSVALRTLAPDDIAGICAIYPPGRNAGECDPTPRHGFGSTCGEPAEDSGGCSTSGGGSAGLWLIVALGLARRKLGTRN